MTRTHSRRELEHSSGNCCLNSAGALSRVRDSGPPDPSMGHLMDYHVGDRKRRSLSNELRVENDATLQRRPRAVERHCHETDKADTTAEGAPTGRVVSTNDVERAAQLLEHLRSDTCRQTRVDEYQDAVVDFRSAVSVEPVRESEEDSFKEAGALSFRKPDAWRCDGHSSVSSLDVLGGRKVTVLVSNEARTDCQNASSEAVVATSSFGTSNTGARPSGMGCRQPTTSDAPASVPARMKSLRVCTRSLLPLLSLVRGSAA